MILCSRARSTHKSIIAGSKSNFARIVWETKLVSTRTWYGGPRDVLAAKKRLVGAWVAWRVSSPLGFSFWMLVGGFLRRSSCLVIARFICSFQGHVRVMFFFPFLSFLSWVYMPVHIFWFSLQHPWWWDKQQQREAWGNRPFGYKSEKKYISPGKDNVKSNCRELYRSCAKSEARKNYFFDGATLRRDVGLRLISTYPIRLGCIYQRLYLHAGSLTV